MNEYLQTSAPDVYAAGDVTGLSGIWPNAMKQGRTAAKNMALGNRFAYVDRFAAKNTINFFGLVSLCVGELNPREGDRVLTEESRGALRQSDYPGS